MLFRSNSQFTASYSAKPNFIQDAKILFSVSKTYVQCCSSLVLIYHIQFMIKEIERQNVIYNKSNINTLSKNRFIVCFFYSLKPIYVVCLFNTYYFFIYILSVSFSVGQCLTTNLILTLSYNSH